MLSHPLRSAAAAGTVALLLVATFVAAQDNRPALKITGPANVEKHYDRFSPSAKVGSTAAFQRLGGGSLLTAAGVPSERARDPRRTLTPGRNRVSTFAAKRPGAASPSIKDLGTGSGDIVETEPNGSTPEPISLPTNVLGEISFDGDVDFFSFQAFAGQQITFEPFATRFPGSLLIADIGLFDANGNIITSSVGNGIQDPLIRFTPTADQVLIIGITDADNLGGAAFDYLLNIVRGIDIDEVEPNGHLPQELATVPVTVFGQIDAPADVDFYSFTGTAGQTLIVDVDATVLGSNLDSELNLTDPVSGAELFFNDDEDGQDSRFNIVLPFTGTYVLGIGSFEGKSAGFYRLNVSLVSGAGAPMITQVRRLAKKLFEVDGTGFLDGAVAAVNGGDARTNFVSGSVLRGKAKTKTGTVITVANPGDGRRSNPIIMQ